MAYYSQNYAGILGSALIIIHSHPSPPLPPLAFSSSTSNICEGHKCSSESHLASWIRYYSDHDLQCGTKYVGECSSDCDHDVEWTCWIYTY